MYVRLAFAVAAHLETDILIVDEVLAVGDIEFQRKCLNKMSEVSQGGRTVLFVSHNLGAIQRICPHSMFIQRGRLAFHGDTGEAIERYLQSARTLQGKASLEDVTQRWGTGELRVTGVEIEDADGAAARVLVAGQGYCLRLHYRRMFGDQPIDGVSVTLKLMDNRGNTVWMVASELTPDYARVTERTGAIECRFDDFNLAYGDYSLTLYIGRPGAETFDFLDGALRVSVAGGDFFGSGHPGLPLHCSTLTRCRWLMTASQRGDSPSMS